ncbi:hypothetical protein Daesc_007927 [Daldinia eschscholtzii]|uniref:Uncharacterized protein n=1 Tax=Daldinia eschscholtzii TaxID=292717 RepID=A0AAX6MGV0_9PEZI
MSDQAGISYSPARINPFANVQVASYPQHVQVADYSQITYLNTQDSEEEKEEEEAIDQEYEPEYDVNEEQFEHTAPYRSPPTIPSPAIIPPKATKEKVKLPTIKEAAPKKQPSPPLTSKQKKQARKKNNKKGKQSAKNAKMTTNTESPESPVSEAVSAEPTPEKADNPENTSPAPQPQSSDSSKPSEPSEPPEPPEEPDGHEAAEVKTEKSIEAEASPPAEPENIPSDEQPSKQEESEPASEPASDTVPKADNSESPLEKADVAADTHPVTTSEGDVPADIQEPDAPSPSAEDSKPDASEQDPSGAGETNGEHPGESNDQETTPTTDVGAISEPQTGEAVGEPTVEPEKLKDVPEESSKAESTESQNATPESISNSEPDSAAVVEMNEPSDTPKTDTEAVQESGDSEQLVGTQTAEVVEEANEASADGNATNDTDETLEKPKDAQDSKTEMSDKKDTTDEEAPSADTKNDSSGEAAKPEASDDPEPSNAALDNPEASRDEVAATTNEPITNPQEQADEDEAGELPKTNEDEGQPVVDTEGVLDAKEIDNATSPEDAPATLPPESETTNQTEKQPSDPAPVESQEQAETSDQVENNPDSATDGPSSVPVVPPNDDAEKLPEADTELEGESKDLKVPDETTSGPTADAGDDNTNESTTGEPDKPQEPEIAPDPEAKEQSAPPEQAAAESQPAPESPADITASDAVPTQDQPISQESASEASASEEPAPPAPTSEESSSQDLASASLDSQEPASQETASEEPVSEESGTQEPAAQEAISKEPVPQDAAPQESASTSEAQVPSEATPEETISQDGPQENVPQDPVSEELVSKEPTSEEPISQESISQEVVSEGTSPKDIESRESAAEEPAHNSDSQEPGPEENGPQGPISQESSSQESASQEADPKIPEDDDPEKLSSEVIALQASDSKESAIEEVVPQEKDSEDSAPQDTTPEGITSKELAPQDPTINNQSLSGESASPDESPAASKDDVKTSPESSTEEAGESATPEVNSPANDSDEHTSSELPPTSTDKPIQEPAQETTPSETAISDENNQLEQQPEVSNAENIASGAISSSEDEFVIVDKSDGEVNGMADSLGQQDQPNGGAANDSSQLNSEGEPQSIAPVETANEDPQGKDEDSSSTANSQESLEDNGDISNSAQPDDTSSPIVEGDVPKSAEPSLPGDTTPSKAEELQAEVEKQELDENASASAEQQVEAHSGVEAPGDEERSPPVPTPVDTNVESSESQAQTGTQVTDAKEEIPTDPDVSSPEVAVESEEPDLKGDSAEPSLNVNEKGVEGDDASVEREPDTGVTQFSPADEATPNDQVIPESEVPAPNDVPLDKSESDLNGAAPVIESEPSQITSTEPESPQQVDGKDISDSPPDLETESTAQAPSEDSVDAPTDSKEAEQQPDPTSPSENGPASEEIPQEPTRPNGEGEETPQGTHSLDQSTEQASAASETENHNNQSEESPNPRQEEQVDTKSDPIPEEAGQLNENEESEKKEGGDTGEQDESHKSSHETPGMVAVPSQNETNPDEAESDATPISAEPKESISPAPTDDTQVSEAEDKEEENIDQAKEEAPASSPLPTESPTEPPKPPIHESSESQDTVSPESTLVEEAKIEAQPVQEDSEAQKDSSSGPPQSDSEHEPAAIEEPEPEHMPQEAIQEESAKEGSTEGQPVSNEQIAEEIHTAPVNGQASAEAQDTQEKASSDPTSTKNQATTEEDKSPSEIPIPDQPQEDEAKEAVDNNSQDAPREPSLETIGKVDDEPESSEPIQEQAPTESQIPTEDKQAEDKTPEDPVPAEDQAPAEDKAAIKGSTPVATINADQVDDAVPAVDLPADQPSESESQETQKEEAEAAQPSDQVIVKEPPVDTPHESDKDPAASEPVEDHISDKPAPDPAMVANTEEPMGQEPKQKLPSSAVIPAESPVDEGNEVESPKETPTEELDVQDKKDGEANASSPDSATSGEVLPQESELANEAIARRQPPEDKETEATGVDDKAIPEEPEVVHAQDSQSEEPVAIPSDLPIQDPITSDGAESLPNTSVADTTQSITTVSEPPTDNSAKQDLAQDSEDHATDKAVDNLEQQEVPRDKTPAPLVSQDLPKNDSDKAMGETQAEPARVQPTESSEPAKAEVTVNVKDASTDDGPVPSADETPKLEAVPVSKTEGGDLPVITEDLESPSDEKVYQSVDIPQQEAVRPPVANSEAEHSAIQQDREIAVSEQAQGKEGDTGPSGKILPEEPLDGGNVRDQTRNDEETVQKTSQKAISVEPIANNQPEPIKAPKENGKVTEKVKAKRIQSDDESKDKVGPIPTDGGPVRKATKGEDQLFSSLVGDTPVVGAIDFDDTPASVPEHLFSVERVENLKESGEDNADVPQKDIEISNKSLTQNYSVTPDEQSQPVTVPEVSVRDEPAEQFHDSSFVDISSMDLQSSQELPSQELDKSADYDPSTLSKEVQSEDGEAVAFEPSETDRDLRSEESSTRQKSEFISPDTTEVLDITTASDVPPVPTEASQPTGGAESARDYSGMVKSGIFRPTAFAFLGGELARRHLVKNDDEQATSSQSLDSREVPVENSAEPEPIAVSTKLDQLEESIISLPDEGSEEPSSPSSPQILSEPAAALDTSVLTKDESDREIEDVHNDSDQQTAEPPESARVITSESPEIIASTVPLSESFTVVKTPIPEKSSKRTLRPPLVHSGTQTEDDLDFGSQPGWSFVNVADLEPRARTPGIMLPDPTDSKAKALGRAKSVRKRRRQTLRQAEEAVATAVILYAAAQELSPSSSSILGSAQIENDIGGTLEPSQEDVYAAGGVSSSSFVAGNQSVGQNDYSLPVADLSTDDEEKRSADERHHRHRRHHHHHHQHHHSSRSKDSKGSGEHLQPRNTRLESSHSMKSSSDRSIPQTPKRDSGFSVESSRTNGSSSRRHRTPEEQAAHERRKEERRAREAYERAQEGRSKDPETPPGDRHSSHRSSRRHSLSHPEKSHTERRSERTQPEKYSERSFSERYAERPHSERYSERSHAERYPAKDSASSSNKRFFDMRHGESNLASNYVPRPRSNSNNVPPPVLREPSKSGPLKRSNTGRSTRTHAESGEIPQPSSHRSHDHYRDYGHDHVNDDPPKRRRSEAKPSGSVESTSSRAAPPSPTKDEHRQSRQRERQRAREAAEAAEAKKKSGGIRAAFKKLFS